MIPLYDNIPSRTFPFVNYSVIGITTAIFLLQLLTEGGQLRPTERFGMVPQRITSPGEPVTIPVAVERQGAVGGYERGEYRVAAPPFDPKWTLLTCIFLHGGWLHFLGNMWILHIFGDNVEDRLGHFGFLIFYLLAGIAASLAQLLTAPESPIPTIGASGAIAGVMGAYFVLYPKAHVVTLLPIFIVWQILVIPAPFFLGIWFLLQLFQGSLAITAAPQGGVAWWAHIGGFVVGVAAAFLLKLTGWARPPVDHVRPHTERTSVFPYQEYRQYNH